MEASKEKFFDITLPCFEGVVLPDFPEFVENIEKRMTEIRNFNSRDTDILLCGYMKSGNHWVLEIIAMLLSGECTNTTETIVNNNLELNAVAKFENKADPRIIQTHLMYRFLPLKHLMNGYKIVLVLRNPKDRLTSMFHMAKGARPELEDLNWSDYFISTIVDKSVPEVFGSWFDYHREWDKELQENLGNIFPIYFEDLKMDFVSNVKKLAEFLGVNRDDSFYEKLKEKCGFSFMKQNKSADLWNVNPSTQTYRKGEVGDWKNLFTVAQNEQFDDIYKREMKGSKLDFRYSL